MKRTVAFTLLLFATVLFVGGSPPEKVNTIGQDVGICIAQNQVQDFVTFVNVQAPEMVIEQSIQSIIVHRVAKFESEYMDIQSYPLKYSSYILKRDNNYNIKFQNNWRYRYNKKLLR